MGKEILKSAEAKISELDEIMPDWCCSECGSTSNHGITYPSSPNGPEEYDLMCDDCGSLNIEGSCAKAASSLGLKLGESRSEISQLRDDVNHWRVKAECYGNMVHGCSPALADAGYPVDASMQEGAVGGIRKSVEAMTLELNRLQKIEQAAEAWSEYWLKSPPPRTYEIAWALSAIERILRGERP